MELKEALKILAENKMTVSIDYKTKIATNKTIYNRQETEEIKLIALVPEEKSSNNQLWPDYHSGKAVYRDMHFNQDFHDADKVVPFFNAEDAVDYFCTLAYSPSNFEYIQSRLIKKGLIRNNEEIEERWKQVSTYNDDGATVFDSSLERDRITELFNTEKDLAAKSFVENGLKKKPFPTKKSAYKKLEIIKTIVDEVSLYDFLTDFYKTYVKDCFSWEICLDEINHPNVSSKLKSYEELSIDDDKTSFTTFFDEIRKYIIEIGVTDKSKMKNLVFVEINLFDECVRIKLDHLL